MIALPHLIMVLLFPLCDNDATLGDADTDLVELFQEDDAQPYSAEYMQKLS